MIKINYFNEVVFLYYLILAAIYQRAHILVHYTTFLEVVIRWLYDIYRMERIHIKVYDSYGIIGYTDSLNMEGLSMTALMSTE